jgi:hypothetical protein
MARFKAGDRVRRDASPAANYVRIGTITAVIPNQHALEMFDEYEVDFGGLATLIAYDHQLTSL